MFSHINMGVSDLELAFAFYDPVFEALGLDLKFNEPTNGWAGWTKAGQEKPVVIISQPFDDQPHAPGNGQMLAFLADDRATVTRCFDAALTAGAVSEGEPGLRPHYHEHYFGAYFRDLDGNKLCICCHNEE